MARLESALTIIASKNTAEGSFRFQVPGYLRLEDISIDHLIRPKPYIMFLYEYMSGQGRSLSSKDLEPYVPLQRKRIHTAAKGLLPSRWILQIECKTEDIYRKSTEGENRVHWVISPISPNFDYGDVSNQQFSLSLEHSIGGCVSGADISAKHIPMSTNTTTVKVSPQNLKLGLNEPEP